MDQELRLRLMRIELFIQRLGARIMKEFDDLQAAVQAETDLDVSIKTALDGVISYIQTIPALIAAAGVDPAKLTALTQQIAANSTAMKSESDALVAAVTANTPAAP